MCVYIYIAALHRVICRAGIALLSFAVSGIQGSGKTCFVLLDFGKQDLARKKSDGFLLKSKGKRNQLWVCYTDGCWQIHQ